MAGDAKGAPQQRVSCEMYSANSGLYTSQCVRDIRVRVDHVDAMFELKYDQSPGGDSLTLAISSVTVLCLLESQREAVSCREQPNMGLLTTLHGEMQK